MIPAAHNDSPWANVVREYAGMPYVKNAQASGMAYDEIADTMAVRVSDLQWQIALIRSGDQKGDTEAMKAKISARAFAMDWIAQLHPEDHAKGACPDFECPKDWLRWWTKDRAAPPGTIPKPGQEGRFAVELEGYRYFVHYLPDISGCTDHMEFRHSRANVPCPLSSSGYYSHFPHDADIDRFRDLEAYAVAVIKANAQPLDTAHAQLSLFD